MTSAISRLRNAVGRHRGWRCLSLVLAFALTLVAWPQLDLHAHAHGGQTHSHAHDAHDPPVPEDQDAPGVIHLHDASSVAWTLPSRQPQIAAMPLAAWIPVLGFASGALPARPPPQRPPIA